MGHVTGSECGDVQSGLAMGRRTPTRIHRVSPFLDGQVNRGDLMEAFGVSVNQSSTDLNRYIAMAATNMFYDKSARTYVRGDEFSPLFLKPESGLYLAQLRSVAAGILDRPGCWIGSIPPYDGTPTPVRGGVAATLRSVVSATRRSKIKVRRSFLHYTLRRLGLDINASARMPQNQQIVLLNPDVLAPKTALALL